MMTIYKQLLNRDGSVNQNCISKDNTWVIPFDPANMDFVEYNKWLALGNQPLPPDEPTLP